MLGGYMRNKRIIIIIAAVVGALLVAGILYAVTSSDSSENEAEITPTPVPEPVNIIPVKDRPYVTLQPLTARNQLELVIHDLKTPADSVEVILEYDRNEGVWDAVLKNFTITDLPLVEPLFLGSKSAGGHITYHDDVIGGNLTLQLRGDEPYALKTPWRYDDKEVSYQELSTSDGKFQVELDEPIRANKVVVMQSPGLPENLDGEVIAGPYLFRFVQDLPEGTATVKIRTSDVVESPTLYGWDGENWQEIDASLEDKTLTAQTEIFQVYAVTD